MSALAQFFDSHPVWAVAALASLTAVATGLGALPFLFLRRVSESTVAYSNAIAAGLMLGATFGLAVEGTTYGLVETLVGANLGILFVLATSRILDHHDIEFGALAGLDARRMVLMVIVMTVHSFAEGVAVGASFVGGLTLATFITVAIAVHNIPEGLAITAVLRPRGVSVPAAAGWSVFSSLPQPLMAVPAFLFVEAFQPALPYALGFAGGAMLLMVLNELLPEAYQEGHRPVVGLLVSSSLFAMILFQQLL